MALAKRTLIMAVIGMVVLVVGVVSGVYVGTNFFTKSQPSAENSIPDPGPMIDLGQFTSTLSDPETRVIRLKITAELTSVAIAGRLTDPGWIVMMKDEIMKTLKDQRYNDVRFAEGMEKLKQDIRARLNAILPKVEAQSAINRVLFDEYMVQ